MLKMIQKQQKVAELIQQVVSALLIAFVVSTVAVLVNYSIKDIAVGDRQFWADVVTNIIIIVGISVTVSQLYNIMPTRLLDKNRMFADEPFIEREDFTRTMKEETERKALSRSIAKEASERRHLLKKSE